MKNPTGLIPQNVTDPTRRVEGDHEAVISASAPTIGHQLTALRALRGWMTGSGEPLTDLDLIGLDGAIRVLSEIRDQLVSSEALEAAGDEDRKRNAEAQRLAARLTRSERELILTPSLMKGLPRSVRYSVALDSLCGWKLGLAERAPDGITATLTEKGHDVSMVMGGGS